MHHYIVWADCDGRSLLGDGRRLTYLSSTYLTIKWSLSFLVKYVLIFFGWGDPPHSPRTFQCSVFFLFCFEFDVIFIDFITLYNYFSYGCQVLCDFYLTLQKLFVKTWRLQYKKHASSNYKPKRKMRNSHKMEDCMKCNPKINIEL